MQLKEFNKLNDDELIKILIEYNKNQKEEYSKINLSNGILLSITGGWATFMLSTFCVSRMSDEFYKMFFGNYPSVDLINVVIKSTIEGILISLMVGISIKGINDEKKELFEQEMEDYLIKLKKDISYLDEMEFLRLQERLKNYINKENIYECKDTIQFVFNDIIKMNAESLFVDLDNNKFKGIEKSKRKANK